MMINSCLDKFAVGTEYKDIITPMKEIYREEESGFSIYIVTNEKGREFKIKGVFITPLNIKRQYKVRGFISSFKNENDLKVKEIAPIRPKSKKAIISYLKTLKGLKSKAELIYETYGDKSIDILLNEPERVADEIQGVGKKSTLKWSQQLKNCFESQDTIARLLELELTVSAAKKLYDAYKDDIILKIETNPYFLVNEVKGYGFEKCDRLAREVGISPQDNYRIEQGVVHVLKQASYEGHCYLPQDELIEKVKELLDIKLNLIEMKRFVYDYRGQEEFEYIVGGNNIYKIDYNELVKSYNKFKDETNRAVKEKHRYVVHDIPLQNIENAINSLIASGKVIVENDGVYLRKLYIHEVATANAIKELVKYDDIYSREYVERILNEIIDKKEIKLEERQREACIYFNTSESGLYALIGGAGCGKTFTMDIILDVAKEIAKRNSRPVPNIKIFAPTGKAAKVAREATGMECSTIHRGLGWQGENGFEFNFENKLDLDRLICDESSMLDISLAKAFFEAISNNTKVILLGDIKQLPAVGPGNVLKDILESGIVRFVELNVIKRQGALSGTVQFANKIINDEMIPKSVDTGDAYFLEKESIGGVKNTVTQSIKNLINNRGYSFDDIQVLIPQRNGSVGVYMFNYVLQQVFNDKPTTKDSILACEFKAKESEESDPKTFKIYFKEGDKVINKNNNYSMVKYKKVKDSFRETTETGVANGETGVIEYIRIEHPTPKQTVKKIMVKFDDFYALYEDDNISSLEHSYAITIHKSQGSAWKAVIIPLTTSSWMMLSNNIIYTAVTRAREFVCVVGSSKAVQKAIKTHTPTMRYTMLKDRLINKEITKLDEEIAC